MATFKLSALITDIKGKMQGTYFKKMNGDVTGVPTSTKSTKADAGRSSAQKVKSTFEYVSRAWAQLLASERIAWQSFAKTETWFTKLGTSYAPNGFAVFMKQNLTIIGLGSSLSSIPHRNAPKNAPIEGNVKFDGPDSMLLFTKDYQEMDVKLQVYATSTLGWGRNAPKNGFKLIGAYQGWGNTPIEITYDYYRIFGKPLDGGKVLFRLVYVSTISGIQTQPYNFQVLTPSSMVWAPAEIPA